MNTLGDVVKETQGLLGDPDGEWVTRDYILPFINTTYRLQYLFIKNATGRNLEQVVEIPGVGLGTTTLYPLQAVGKPLCGLTDPLWMQWKLAGQPGNCYAPARPKETLPFTGAPGAPTNSFTPGLFWTWMGNKLLVTPLAAAVDMLIGGRFNPPPLLNDADILVVSPDLQSVLSTGAAAMVGIERTNPAVLAGYAQACEAGLDNIVADLIRQKQGFSKRLGRQTRSCGWGWY